jgi:predicted O-methyltransferase YrrM
MKLIRHEEPAVVTALPPYERTYAFPSPYINEDHAYYDACPMFPEEEKKYLVDLGIDGWLRREDALKIYELAFFARGPVLELGSYQGLSTSIISRANLDGKTPKEIVSVELDPAALAKAKTNLESRGLLPHVRQVQQEAAAFCREEVALGRTYDFVFIDHDHAYSSVLDVCREFGKLVAPGGFCLFHDYLDIRNYDPNNKDYGVFQAVRDGLQAAEFESWGIFGVTGLYRRTSRPASPG